MKNIVLFIGILTGLVLTADNMVPKHYTPCYFYGYQDTIVQLDVEFVESGQVESYYKLRYFKTYDSCITDMYVRGYTVKLSQLGLDSLQLLHKLDSMGLPDFRDKIIWDKVEPIEDYY